MKQIPFFALKDDLVSILDEVERGGPLMYVRFGQVLTGGPGTYGRGAEISGLGRANSVDASGCETFLVYEPGTRITLRKIGKSTGAERVVVDQLINPDTIAFIPAGNWNDEVVLFGRAATASDSGASQKLMKRFSVAIRKAFSKIDAFWVGPQALVLLKDGKRLTISVHSPREFDLSIPSAP